jgi:hypothetical protein
MCTFLFFFFTLFIVSRHILGPTRCFSHFFPLSVLMPYSSSYSVNFSFFTVFTVSHHIPGPSMCVSLCTFFSVSCHISCLTM